MTLPPPLTSIVCTSYPRPSFVPGPLSCFIVFRGQASYMFTMSALVQSGQWGRARSLVEVMAADGMPPKVGCYSHLLTLLHTRCVGGKGRIKNRM